MCRRSKTVFGVTLATVLVAALAFRVAYVLVQPADDPEFALPALDGAYYVEWSRALVSGEGSPPGAYYLPPLYPYTLSRFLLVFGESWMLLFLLQHVAALGTAALLALTGRRLVGEAAGIVAAALFLTYHPVLFFASRPLGETLAILLLALGVYLYTGPGKRGGLPAGMAMGLAALARPNFLLVPATWLVQAGIHRRWQRCALLAIGVALLLAPVMVRNWIASGHPVVVSSQAGVTLYHGNAPHALGIGAMPAGFSGDIASQRDDAIRVARARSGEDLDAVEADRLWGRAAIRARLVNPAGSLGLLLRRAGLSIANAELGSTYAPTLDRNPWRWSAPVPFCLLLALAAVGAYLAGFARTGGWIVWSTVFACLATPLLFYVSSRYRLPAAAMLCVPAGAGAVELVRAARGRAPRFWLSLLLALACGVVSLTVPTRSLLRTTEAAALIHRAQAWLETGDPRRAEVDLRRAVRLDSRSAAARTVLARQLRRTGRETEAVEHYRQALATDPAHRVAAADLSYLLIVQGRPDVALTVVTRALEAHPDDAACQINRIDSLRLLGRLEEARSALGEAERHGVAVDPRLRRALRGSE